MPRIRRGALNGGRLSLYPGLRLDAAGVRENIRAFRCRLWFDPPRPHDALESLTTGIELAVQPHL